MVLPDETRGTPPQLEGAEVAAAALPTRRELRELEARAGRRRRTRRSTTREPLGKRIASIAVVVLVGALLVAVSVPANVFIAASGQAAERAGGDDLEGQTVEGETLASVTRDGFEVSGYFKLFGFTFRQTDSSYSVNSTGPIRWPFPVAVPISDGFGDRVAPCRGCSSDHQGTDFVPGRGAPILAIADGVVVDAGVSTWGLGNFVVIEHVIRGQKITSTYGHMQWNSARVGIGDRVSVGDWIGSVGSTGASTGPHLHFEIRFEDDDNRAVDAFVWLKANAVGD